MRGSIVTGPLFSPDGEEEYLDPGDVEMDDDESDTPHAENNTPELPESTATGEVTLFRCISRPLPQYASNTQEHRNNMEMDNNDGNSHSESIMPAPPQNTGACAGTVVLFRQIPDSPLFKIGSKRPVDEDEEDRNRKEEERKHQVHINVRAIRLYNNRVC
jgi:hypothetical protein